MTLIDEYSLQKVANNYFLEYEANKIINEYIEDYISIVKESIFKMFTIRNEEVANFFLENDDVILMLQKIEPIIREFFPDEELVLEFVPDPGWVGQLVLYIQTIINESNIDELYSKIEKIENSSRTILSDELRKKFLIDVE